MCWSRDHHMYKQRAVAADSASYIRTELRSVSKVNFVIMQ